MHDDTLPDRTRRVVAIAAILAVATLAVSAVAIATVSMTDTAEASVAVNDFSVPDSSTEAETVEHVTFELGHGTISWADAPEPVEEVEFTVYVEGPDGEMQALYDDVCMSDYPEDACGFERATQGSTFSSDVVEVYPIDDGDWTVDHFSPEPGETVEHTMDVTIEAVVLWDGGSATGSVTDSTTITVQHPEDGNDADDGDAANDDEGADDDAQEDVLDPEVEVDFGTAEVWLD